MVYGAPYPWYFDPPTHGISTPLSMVFWPPIHGMLTPCLSLDFKWWGSKYHRGSIYHTGGSVFNKGDQNIIWHRSFLHSWPNTGFLIRLTRRVPLVEQEQLTFPHHPRSVPVFRGFCVTRSLVLCVCFVDHCLYFFAIVLSVLRFTYYYYSFRLGTLKLFLRKAIIHFPIGFLLKHFVAHFSFCFEETLYRTFHRCFLPNCFPFGNWVSEEKNFKKLTNQKKELSLVAMFFNRSRQNE